MVVVGYYQLSRVVGRGRYGWVSRAKHQVVGRQVAVKHVPWAFDGQCKGNDHSLCDHVGEASCKAALEHEAAMLAKVSHPAVVALLEVVRTPAGITWVCLEDLGNISLSILVTEKGNPGLPEMTVLPLIKQIAAGLEYMHNLGLLHRDVKPDNIMVVGDEFPVAKIIDLGLAAVWNSQIPLCTSHTRAGTVAYMAPELMKNNNDYGIKVDVFSLGASLYYGIAGNPPFCEFKHGTVRSTTSIFGLQAEHIDALEDMLPTVSNILLAMLHIEPSVRCDLITVLNCKLAEELLISSNLSLITTDVALITSNNILVTSHDDLNTSNNMVTISQDSLVTSKSTLITSDKSLISSNECLITYSTSFINSENCSSEIGSSNSDSYSDNGSYKKPNESCDDFSESSISVLETRIKKWDMNIVVKVSVLIEEAIDAIVQQLHQEPWGPVAGMYHLLILDDHN